MNNHKIVFYSALFLSLLFQAMTYAYDVIDVDRSEVRQMVEEAKARRAAFEREAIKNEFVRAALRDVDAIANGEVLTCGRPENEPDRIRQMKWYAYYIQEEAMLDVFRLLLDKVCIMTQNHISTNERVAHFFGTALYNYDNRDRAYSEAEREYEEGLSELMKIISAKRQSNNWP